MAVMTALVLWVGMYGVHDFADYWLQTSHQAAHKAARGWYGRLACLRHVTGYTAAQALSAALLVHVTGTPLPPVALLAALAVSGGTHYVLDRRAPLHWLVRLADRLHLGKTDFVDRGGAPHLDQAAHKLMITVAAVVGAGLA